MIKNKKFRYNSTFDRCYSQPICNPLKEIEKLEKLDDFPEIIKTIPIIVQKPIHWRKIWNKYKKECWKITKNQDLSSLENYDKRIHGEIIKELGFGKCVQSKELYSLDHKISIWYGYKNNIPAEIIGHINNLRYIPSYQNGIKGTKCE